MTATDPDDFDVTEDITGPDIKNQPTDQDDQQLQQFGRYQVLSFLAKGGFGAVYEGLDQQLQRKVAIKVPLIQPPQVDSEHYLIEAQNLAKLQHRGIVSVFDVGIEQGQIYIVTELLDGDSLYRWLRNNKPDWRTSAEIVAQLADALAHAHARKVIHRDIKPGNIIMTADRGPVLVDFGLALSGTHCGEEIGTIRGTLAYMAPEQVEGRAHRIDGRTDIHALGTVLYQLLTRSIPFDAESRQELVRQILHDAPQPPRQIDPGIPEMLEAVCMRAMAKAVADRYTTAADMAKVLREIAATTETGPPTDAMAITRTEPHIELERHGDQPTPTPSSSAVAGRRHVTILHVTASVRGVSEDRSEFDPEDQIEAIQIFQKACRDHFDQFGGSLLPSGGQEALVCFGYPLSYEDAPRRAILAGLEIKQMLPSIGKELAERLQCGLQVWISIHSGMVITSGPDSESLIGDVMTLVTKIDRETDPGDVVISEDTYRLVKNGFQCERLAATCRLPGQTDVALYRVERAIPRESCWSEAEGVEYTPLVGRDQEVGMLHDRWELVGEGFGQLVALIGDAGLGKSRLVQELKEHVENASATAEPPIIEWACSPYHAGSAFYPAKQTLEQILGFQREQSDQEKRRRLKSYLHDLQLDLATAMPLFGELLSLPPDDEYPPLALSSPRKKELTLDYLHEWLRAHAQRRPTLFIVEDLHWIDPSTLDFLHQLADAPINDPLLCVLTFRPEFSTPWTSRAHQTQIALNRLTRSQVSQILTTKVEGGRVASGIIDRIAQRTDGVPLFVEEYSKMLVESTQSLSDTVEFWPESTAGGHSGVSSIPTTLQGLLTARLDRVVGDPSVVRLAAALGREFSYEMIAAACELPEAQLMRELDKLVDSELLFRRGSPPNSSYLFKHALIQDAAYDAMLRRQRRHVHQNIADALESKFPETIDRRPELLAHHRTEAGQPAQAAPLWEAAGSTATDRGAFVEAVQHLQRGMHALESVPASRERDEQEYRINVPLGIATLSVKGYAAPELGAIYDRRMELCEKLSDPLGKLHAKWAMGSWRIVRDEVELSLEIGEQIMVMGREMQDDGALMEALFIQAIAQFYHADFQQSLESCQQGWQLYDHDRCLIHTRSTGQHSGVANLCYMALCHWYLGQPASALARMEEGLRLAESIDHPFSVAFALHHFGWLNTAMQRGQEAVECGERQIEVSREQAFFFWETTGMLFRAGGLNCLERYEEARESLQQGLARYEATGAKLALAQYLSFLAEAQWKLGDLEAAGQSLSAALAAVDQSADRFHEPQLWRLRGQLAAAEGDMTAASSHAQRAIELARRYGAVSWELAALLDLAQWTDHGEARDQLIDQIRQIIDRFERCDTPIAILQRAAELL